MNENDSDEITPPIYERVEAQASDRRRIPAALGPSISGAAAGAAAWLFLVLLGIPQVFGIGLVSGLLPLSLAGALFAHTPFRPLFPIAAASLTLLAAIVAYTPVIESPSLALIRSDPVPPSADAVVALSAGVTADGFLTQQGLDRALTAARMVKSGVAPVLVFTREVKRDGKREYDTSADQKRIASLAGIKETIFAGSVTSTHDEARAVASLATLRRWRRIVLVTSPFHTRRACATFEKEGLVVSCVPSDSRDIAVAHLDHPGDRLRAFGMWIYETAGTLRYRQLGWI